jgi:TetR/AcrR family transcriptional repressor of mexJK operon
MDDRPEATRRRILDTAKELFLERGFNGATTEEIARVARVSKATLYKLFPDKDALLMAIVERGHGRVFTSLDRLPSAADHRRALIDFALEVLRSATSPAMVQIHRLIISRVPHQPELGDAYRARSIKPAHDALAAALLRLDELGRLRCPDPEPTAERFLGMVESRVMLRELLEGRTPLGETELEREAAACVDLLLGSLQRGSQRD